MASEKQREAARRSYQKNREAIRARIKADRIANPEKYRALDRDRYERDKAKRLAYGKARYQDPRVKRLARDKTLRRDFGISLERDAEQFDRMLIASAGRCAICNSKFERPNEPHVDHCHRTKDVRGLLCNHCNYGLGFFKDNARLLIEAASYLKGGGQKE